MKFSGFRDFKNKLFAKSVAKIERFRLSVYGKLPIYKDYILWECHRPGAEEFKLWLDQAFGLPWDEFGGKNARPRCKFRVIWAPAGSKHVIAASMWPSADEGNLRKFPFTLFGVFGRSETIGNGVGGAVGVFCPVWKSMEELYPAMKAQSDVQTLYTYLQVTDPEIKDEPAAEEENLNVREWFEAMAPLGDRGYGARMQYLLRETIEGYNSFDEGGAALAVRLPLAARGPSVALQAETWAQAFQKNVKKCPAFPTVLIELNDDDRPTNVVLIWRELMREDGRLFAEKSEAFEYLEDIAAKAGGTTSYGESEELPADPDAWIESLGKG